MMIIRSMCDNCVNAAAFVQSIVNFWSIYMKERDWVPTVSRREQTQSCAALRKTPRILESNFVATVLQEAGKTSQVVASDVLRPIHLCP